MPEFQRLTPGFVLQHAFKRSVLIAILFAFTAAPAALARLNYTPAQSDTARELVQTLQKRHYSRLEYDALLASAHVDSFLDKLDPGRMYFLASDISEFQAYKRDHQREFAGGRLDAGYEVFARYQQRLTARLGQLIGSLEGDIASYDFDEEEYLPLAKRADIPWAATSLELDDRWRKQLKNQVLSLRLSEKPTDEIIDLLRKRYKNQLRRSEQFNSQDVFQLYANALAELYDPHTGYLSPRNFEVFNMNMSLKLEGIGAVLQAEDEYTRVARLVPAGPADKQGDLRPSDRIVGVGQGDSSEVQDVVGWRLDDVVDLIKGPKGSTVRLEVIGSDAVGGDRRREIAIVRDTVRLEEQSAQKSVLEIPEGDEIRRIGVIDVPAFYIDFDGMRRGDPEYRSTTRDVRNLVRELESENIDGLIIDLRNNGGGSLQEANELTGLFIEHGPTVQIRHSSRRVFRDGKRDRGSFYDGPLVVLINRLSASASEIFAGAIQDYGRGVVVGDQSFGKGTVQTLVPLPEGQLKVTESKFYRISGESTQHRGVVPDVEFPALLSAEDIGESVLDNALPWDQINPVNYRRYSDYRSIVPELAALFQRRSATDPDLAYLKDQVAMAREARNLDRLPLREADRIAMREQQRTQRLEIQNRRREAKGLPLLADSETAESVDDDEIALVGAEGEMEAAMREDDVELKDDSDILLREAGMVLLDALNITEQRYAHSAALLGDPGL